MADMVNHPKHYLMYPVEVIDIVARMNFCLGNAIKYILRAPYKGAEAEDLEKAIWYLNALQKRLRCYVLSGQPRSDLMECEKWCHSVHTAHAIRSILDHDPGRAISHLRLRLDEIKEKKE